MINGVPVNDMETELFIGQTGWIYPDVTSAMQVQRGLGIF